MNSPFTATRPFFLFNYTEYLIVTGDLVLWAWFNKSDLADAFTNSSLFSSDFCYSINAYTSNSPTKKRGIPVCFQGSQRLLILLSLPSSGSLNDSRSAIYGELSTQADKSLSLISVFSHNGVNVFVRNSNGVMPYSKQLIFILQDVGMDLEHYQRNAMMGITKMEMGAVASAK